jgi:hypothetical protein
MPGTELSLNWVGAAKAIAKHQLISGASLGSHQVVHHMGSFVVVWWRCGLIYTCQLTGPGQGGGEGMRDREGLPPAHGPTKATYAGVL